jgi:glycine C-acetyltransferase/8-amino-7-oxononanoate synthase
VEERPQRVRRLAANAATLREALGQEGFDVSHSRTQILPLLMGDPRRALQVCEAALAQGVFAQAIRPPTVPPMTSRLRLAVMATHREDELRAAARTLGAAVRATGADPSPRHAAPVRQLPAEPAVFDFEAPEPVRRAA